MSSPAKIFGNNAIGGINRVENGGKLDFKENDMQKNSFMAIHPIDLTIAPSVHSRQISSSTIDLSLNAKSPSKEDGTNSKKNGMGIGDQARQGLHSPTPNTPTPNGSSAKVATPSNLSHSALTLAQLYQSSRRSRHNTPESLGCSLMTHPIEVFPSPPLFSNSPSSPVNQDQVWQKMEHVISNIDDEEWSFDIARPICTSCSYKSLSSMETQDELITPEPFEANEELFDEDLLERDPKRRKC